MKRSLLALLAGLALLATSGAAAAGQPYGFPGASLSLSQTNGSFLAAIDGPQSIFDVVSPLRLTVSVIGPPSGSKIAHLAVAIRGIGCSLDCHTERLDLRVPRLADRGSYGFRSVTVRTDTWGAATRVSAFRSSSAPGRRARSRTGLRTPPVASRRLRSREHPKLPVLSW
jgi:hypothetical protein